MRNPLSNQEAETLALHALGWTLSDPDRAGRLLALTGLDPAAIRAGAAAGDAGMLAAVLDFLERHEPDLVAAAAAIGTEPARLIAARALLEG